MAEAVTTKACDAQFSDRYLAISVYLHDLVYLGGCGLILEGADMQVRAYVTLRDLLGKSRFDWTPPAGATVRDVLAWLAADCPEFGRKLWDDTGKLTGYVQVFVNGRAVQYLDGLDTPVADSDKISLFPPVAGGASE